MSRALSCFTLCLLACAPASTLTLPEGTRCTKTVTAGMGAQALADALALAQPGTCVVAAPGTYAASFTVPPGVILAADLGSSVVVQGAAPEAAALTLGAGAVVSEVTVATTLALGISGVGGGARLINVKVSGARSAGVVFWCEDDCRVDPTLLINAQLTANAVGLLVHGANVKVTGGTVSGSTSAELASGYGVVASAGAQLQLVDTVVDRNEALGVLIDGARGTQTTLQRVAVRDNGRGVWAQDLDGTAAAPRLTLEGCTLERNTLVGLGMRASRGVRVQGGRVASTLLGPAGTGTPGVFVTVGDGLGLFVGSGEVQVDGVTLDDNQRSQVLIDSGAAGLAVTGGAVTPKAGQLGVVVQRTTPMVIAPSITVPQPGQELPFAAPAIAVPTR